MRAFIYQNNYEIAIFMMSLIVLLIISREWMRFKDQKVKRYNGLEVGSASFIGDREFQEDAMNVASLQKGTLAVLADGRGKNKAGKLSSALAAKIFVKLFNDHNSMPNVNYFFKRAFNITNREILNQLEDNQGGASIVCAIIMNNLLHYALVGNTMIAVFRNNELIPLSEGHTVNVLARKGFYQGKISKQKALWALKEKRLFNYVGQDGFQDVEVYDVPVELKNEDMIVLMSDGVHHYVPWNQLEDAMKKNESCTQIAEDIMKIVNDHAVEDKDNASMIIMRYRENKLRV